MAGQQDSQTTPLLRVLRVQIQYFLRLPLTAEAVAEHAQPTGTVSMEAQAVVVRLVIVLLQPQAREVQVHKDKMVVLEEVLLTTGEEEVVAGQLARVQ